MIPLLVVCVLSFFVLARTNNFASTAHNVLAGPRWTTISSQNEESSEKSSPEGHGVSGREAYREGRPQVLARLNSNPTTVNHRQPSSIGLLTVDVDWSPESSPTGHKDRNSFQNRYQNHDLMMW